MPPAKTIVVNADDILVVVMAGNRERAARLLASILRRAAIHRYRELRVFAGGIEQ